MSNGREEIGQREGCAGLDIRVVVDGDKCRVVRVEKEVRIETVYFSVLQLLVKERTVLNTGFSCCGGI